jgi:HD superfamily phosphohydrolase
VVVATQPKIFRDPVHGFISLPRDTVLRIVDTKEFQRLRRIRQLGTTSLTYHGGEHSRFAHSLGVYHLFRSIIDRLESIDRCPCSEEILAGELAALLHDVGHGPFSHALEGKLTGKGHEEWTIEAITSEESGIFSVLREIDSSLPERVASIIRGGPTSMLCHHIISSQFDADRMDYLLRDALATGNSIGRFDVDRVLATLDVQQNQLAFGDQYLAEQFIFARYFAYWQIYFHKTTRGFDILLQAIWKRAKWLSAEEKLDVCPNSMKPFLGDKVSLSEYLAVDDQDVIQAVKEWAGSEDKVLSDLSGRFLYRRPFKCVETTSRPDISEIAKEVVYKQGYKETDYYVFLDTPSTVPYSYYTVVEEEEDERPLILVLDRSTGKYVEISTISAAVRSVAGQRITKVRVYLPDEDCRRIFREKLK